LLNGFNPKDTAVFDAKLKILDNQGLSMSQLQNEGNSLLHIAAKKNDLDLLKRLKPYKIDVNAKNNEGYTALHIAAMKAKNSDILKYLIEQGANKGIKTEFEETALTLANENEQLQAQNAPLNFLR
jgi:ankyrin repeat protein